MKLICQYVNTKYEKRISQHDIVPWYVTYNLKAALSEKMNAKEIPRGFVHEVSRRNPYLTIDKAQAAVRVWANKDEQGKNIYLLDDIIQGSDELSKVKFLNVGYDYDVLVSMSQRGDYSIERRE